LTGRVKIKYFVLSFNVIGQEMCADRCVCLNFSSFFDSDNGLIMELGCCIKQLFSAVVVIAVTSSATTLN
jgi:hypothetical protein